MPERLRRLPIEVRAGLCVLWTLVLLQLTLGMPPNLESVPIPALDKVLHLGGWMILALLGAALADSQSAVLGAFAAALLVGLLVEAGQTILPGRSFEFLDLVADGVGAAIGVGWDLHSRWKA